MSRCTTCGKIERWVEKGQTVQLALLPQDTNNSMKKNKAVVIH